MTVICAQRQKAGTGNLTPLDRPRIVLIAQPTRSSRNALAIKIRVSYAATDDSLTVIFANRRADQENITSPAHRSDMNEQQTKETKQPSGLKLYAIIVAAILTCAV